MHADVHRRKCETNGRDRRDHYGARRNGQLHVHLRQRRHGTRNTDHMLARVTRFDPSSLWWPRIVMQVVIGNGNVVRAVVMAVVV